MARPEQTLGRSGAAGAQRPLGHCRCGDIFRALFNAGLFLPGVRRKVGALFTNSVDGGADLGRADAVIVHQALHDRVCQHFLDGQFIFDILHWIARLFFVVGII